jgi:hypothetical protein
MADKKDMQKYLQQTHDNIFANNRKWAEEQKSKNPKFFDELSAGQAPDYLWIGEFVSFLIYAWDRWGWYLVLVWVERVKLS